MKVPDRRSADPPSSPMSGALLALAVLLAAPPAATAEEMPSVAALVELFDDVAFGREMEVQPDADRRLIKWAGPVRIGIERIGGEVVLEDDAGARIERVVMRGEPVSEAARRTVERHVATLRAVSGHDIALAGTDETPTLWVTLTTVPFMGRLEITGVTRPLLKRLAAPGRCYFVSFAGRGGVIRRARVVANRLLPPARLEHCLLEELTQALGLPNDSNRIRPSIFSDRDTPTSLSAADALVLRVLYHPLMTPGMPREAALWRAEGLFRKLQPNGG